MTWVAWPGFPNESAWDTGVAPPEADEKESQLKQNLEVAQAAGWDGFMVLRLACDWTYLNHWTILNHIEPYYWFLDCLNEKLRLLHELPAVYLYRSGSNHLFERFFHLQQEEAKASAQSLQETLAAKKEAGNTKEWAVDCRPLVFGLYMSIPSRQKGIDSRRLESDINRKFTPEVSFVGGRGERTGRGCSGACRGNLQH